MPAPASRVAATRETHRRQTAGPAVRPARRHRGRCDARRWATRQVDAIARARGPTSHDLDRPSRGPSGAGRPVETCRCQCVVTVKKSRLQAVRYSPGIPFCPGTIGRHERAVAAAMPVQITGHPLGLMSSSTARTTPTSSTVCASAGTVRRSPPAQTSQPPAVIPTAERAGSGTPPSVAPSSSDRPCSPPRGHGRSAREILAHRDDVQRSRRHVLAPRADVGATGGVGDDRAEPGRSGTPRPPCEKDPPALSDRPPSNAGVN